MSRPGDRHPGRLEAVRALLILTVFLVPLATALPAPDGATVCDAAGGASACGLVMTAGATARVTYTQEIVGCSSASSCTYRPTAHLSLDVVAPGTWVVRASTWATHHPTQKLLSGSHRELACSVEGPDATCADSALGRDVLGNPFNSAQWHAEWRVYFVDALGAEHLQARGSGAGWLAQYCECES